MILPTTPLIHEELLLALRWSAASTYIFTIARQSSSLCPTRHVGEITISFSETEDIPARLSGGIPEDWNDGRRIVALCRALLNHVNLPENTPYDASFYFGSPKIGLVADIDKDGNAKWI